MGVSSADPPSPVQPSVRGRVAKGAAVLALILAIAGTGMSAYLAVEKLQGESDVCTDVAHGCATVQQSPYGKIVGVPVSVLGLAGYIFLVGLAVAWLTGFRGGRAFAAFLGFYGTLAALLFSAYLTYLEAFVIDAWCIYCITSASLVSILFIRWGLIPYAEVRAARSNDGG